MLRSCRGSSGSGMSRRPMDLKGRRFQFFNRIQLERGSDPSSSFELLLVLVGLRIPPLLKSSLTCLLAPSLSSWSSPPPFSIHHA